MSQAALSDSIAAALSATLPAGELKALIGKVSNERRAIAANLETTQARSLDPTLPAKAAVAERERADGARFDLERLETAETKLGAALKAAIARETDQRKMEHFNKVRAERDKLAEDLERYPALARELVALLARIDANDEALRLANQQLPVGARPLVSAELKARGVPSYLRDSAGSIPRLGDVILPAFRRDDAMRPYMWARGLKPDQRNPG